MPIEKTNDEKLAIIYESALNGEELSWLVWFIESGNGVQQLYEIASAHLKLRNSV